MTTFKMETQANGKSVGEARPEPAEDVEQQSSRISLEKNDLLQQEHTDPVLNAKMHLVNNVSHISTFPQPERLNPWKSNNPQRPSREPASEQD